MDKGQRVSRLLEMVSLLQSGTGWDATALAKRFGVSRTRIFNDVRALRGAGIPVQRSRSGYRIAPSFFLPSLRLTPQEVLSLLFPTDLLAGPEADQRVQESALAKLLSCLPEPLRASAEDMLRRTSVLVPASGAEAGIFEQLRGAVADRRRITIMYAERMSGRLERYEVDPYGLAFRKHAWYMLAWSLRHREVRKFRLSRVAAVELSALHFTVPKDFSVEDYFQGAWFVFGGQPQEVGLRFSPRVAQLVRERRPSPGQQIQTMSDGTIYYRAVVKNLDEVAWWIVEYGGEATVLYPPELRDKVIDLARGVLEQYGMRVLRPQARYPEAASELDGRVGEAEEPPAEG